MSKSHTTDPDGLGGPLPLRMEKMKKSLSSLAAAQPETSAAIREQHIMHFLKLNQ